MAKEPGLLMPKVRNENVLLSVPSALASGVMCPPKAGLPLSLLTISGLLLGKFPYRHAQNNAFPCFGVFHVLGVP